MNNAKCYSPAAPEQYSRECPSLGRIGIGAELSTPEHLPLWNLYWLSEPRVDDLLNGGGSKLDMKMFRACGKALWQTVGGRFVHELTAELSSGAFADALLADPHEHLAPFKLRGQAWLDTVQSRARLFRGVVREEGTVSYVRFAGRPVTTLSHSAKIMPLALVKSTT